VAEQNDPEVVRREYSDEKGLAGRQSLWARRRGGQPLDLAFDEVVALRPRRVLEVGCGQGEFAARLVAHGLDVVAVDQSERMVELARERGVDARVGDLQELPFGADDFDLFFRENGEAYLREHYEDVRMVDVPGTISMTAEDMRHYIAHSVAHKHLADRVPSFAGPTTVTASSCVFVAAR
jgi:SAM-dependent methyltransferase